MDYGTIYKEFKKISKKHSNKTAIISEEYQVTYNDLNIYIDRFVDFLKINKVVRNAKIGLLIENKIDMLIAMLSVNACNAIIVPIYPRTGLEKLKSIIDDYQINFLIHPKVFEGFEQVGENIAQIFSDCKYILTEHCCRIDAELDEIPILLFTSGTTGKPKAIMLTNENVLKNIEGTTEYLGINYDDIVLHMKQLFHASSIISEALLAILNGCTIVMMNSIVVPNSIIQMVRKYKITYIFTIPMILKDLLNYARHKSIEMKSVKVINFYGSRMNDSDIKELISHFRNINFIYSYGLTEASPRVTYCDKKSLLIKNGSSGIPIDGVDIIIKDVNGNKCPCGIEGDIFIGGHGVMKGYYMNPKLTKDVVVDGYLNTGDRGYIDAEGYLYVLGRKDNMFVYGGKNIYPEEIESVINNFSGVNESLVTIDNLKIIAYVSANMHKYNEKEVMKHCKNYLEDYKIPHEIRVVDYLEKTSTGKIIRSYKEMEHSG